MPFHNECTVIFSLKNFPDTYSSDDLATVFYNELSEYDDIEAFQILPRSVCKVTFSDSDTKKDFCKSVSFFVGNIECKILNYVLVHHYPVEAPENLLSDALNQYGKIESSRFQIWSHIDKVSTGTRLFNMNLKQDIPRNIRFYGYRVKVWYKERPLECDIRQGHHKVADCDLRRKCCLCRQTGHFAASCPSPWGTDRPPVSSATSDPTPAEAVRHAPPGPSSVSCPPTTPASPSPPSAVSVATNAARNAAI